MVRRLGGVDQARERVRPARVGAFDEEGVIALSRAARGGFWFRDDDWVVGGAGGDYCTAKRRKDGLSCFEGGRGCVAEGRAPSAHVQREREKGTADSTAMSDLVATQLVDDELAGMRTENPRNSGRKKARRGPGAGRGAEGEGRRGQAGREKGRGGPGRGGRRAAGRANTERPRNGDCSAPMRAQRAPRGVLRCRGAPLVTMGGAAAAEGQAAGCSAHERRAR